MQFELDDLLEKYSMWLQDERKCIKENKELIKKAVDLGQISKVSKFIKNVYFGSVRIDVLMDLIGDLESLKVERNEEY